MKVFRPDKGKGQILILFSKNYTFHGPLKRVVPQSQWYCGTSGVSQFVPDNAGVQ